MLPRGARTEVITNLLNLYYEVTNLCTSGKVYYEVGGAPQIADWMGKAATWQGRASVRQMGMVLEMTR